MSSDDAKGAVQIQHPVDCGCGLHKMKSFGLFAMHEKRRQLKLKQAAAASLIQECAPFIAAAKGEAEPHDSSGVTVSVSSVTVPVSPPAASSSTEIDPPDNSSVAQHPLHAGQMEKKGRRRIHSHGRDHASLAVVVGLGIVRQTPPTNDTGLLKLDGNALLNVMQLLTFKVTTVYEPPPKESSTAGGEHFTAEIQLSSGVHKFSKSLLCCSGCLVGYEGGGGQSQILLPKGSRVQCVFRKGSEDITGSDFTTLHGLRQGSTLTCLVVRRKDEPLTSSGAVVLDGIRVINTEIKTPRQKNILPEKNVRFAFLAKWITTELHLQAGGQCLDIAGGKGALSLALSDDFGINCVVVDPASKGTPKAGVDMVASTVERFLAAHPLFMGTTCSFVAALHPDQATDIAIDEALLVRVPFAVIPCCVFPTLFSQRKLANGHGVNTYAGLIRFLLEKDPRIRVAELPFQGRSTVLFMTSADYSQGDGCGKRGWKDDDWFPPPQSWLEVDRDGGHHGDDEDSDSDI